MKRFFAIIVAALALAASALAEQAVVYGTLLRYKNPPALVKELPSAGREFFVIRFAEPFEAEHSNWENEDGGHAGKVRVTEIQVYYQGETTAPLAALVGKKVIAEGSLRERILASQARALILYVEPGHIKAGAFMPVPEAPVAAGKGTE